MYNVNAWAEWHYKIVCTQIDRGYFLRRRSNYRLSGNIFAEDSINASVLESEEP